MTIEINQTSECGNNKRSFNLVLDNLTNDEEQELLLIIQAYEGDDEELRRIGNKLFGKEYPGTRDKIWVIRVGGGYGSFLFDGTEEEAEDMRIHKAVYEHAIARKRLADEDEITYNKINECANHPNFDISTGRYYCVCEDCKK